MLREVGSRDRLRLTAMSGVGLMLMTCAACLTAQQPAPQLMGTVATHDALVTGGLEVQGEQARLLSNASVTAYDRTASVQLDRGGEVLVCATSAFHLLHSGQGKSLLFGLDRGALELHTSSEAQDVILTPDIRFTVEAKGTYDLRLRVAPGGDTCVENVGAGSPVLMLNEAFSPASYRVMPGQHVLFEHGSLREVVDNERSPCGCPPVVMPLVVSANATAAEKAQAEHPFPAAASEGLTPAQPVEQASPTAQVEADTTFSHAQGRTTASTTVPPAPAATAVPASTEPPPAPPGAHDLAHKIGRFFHRLFHRNS